MSTEMLTIISVLVGGGLVKIIDAFVNARKAQGQSTIELIVKSSELNQQTIDSHKEVAAQWKESYEKLEVKFENYRSRKESSDEKFRSTIKELEQAIVELKKKIA